MRDLSEQGATTLEEFTHSDTNTEHIEEEVMAAACRLILEIRDDRGVTLEMNIRSGVGWGFVPNQLDLMLEDNKALHPLHEGHPVILLYSLAARRLAPERAMPSIGEDLLRRIDHSQAYVETGAIDQGIRFSQFIALREGIQSGEKVAVFASDFEIDAPIDWRTVVDREIYELWVEFRDSDVLEEALALDIQKSFVTPRSQASYAGVFTGTHSTSLGAHFSLDDEPNFDQLQGQTEQHAAVFDYLIRMAQLRDRLEYGDRPSQVDDLSEQKQLSEETPGDALSWYQQLYDMHFGERFRGFRRTQHQWGLARLLMRTDLDEEGFNQRRQMIESLGMVIENMGTYGLHGLPEAFTVFEAFVEDRFADTVTALISLLDRMANHHASLTFGGSDWYGFNGHVHFLMERARQMGPMVAFCFDRFEAMVGQFERFAASEQFVDTKHETFGEWRGRQSTRALQDLEITSDVRFPEASYESAAQILNEYPHLVTLGITPVHFGDQLPSRESMRSLDRVLRRDKANLAGNIHPVRWNDSGRKWFDYLQAILRQLAECPDVTFAEIQLSELNHIPRSEGDHGHRPVWDHVVGIVTNHHDGSIEFVCDDRWGVERCAVTSSHGNAMDAYRYNRGTQRYESRVLVVGARDVLVENGLTTPVATHEFARSL
jgi:hypothetical protein